MKWDRNSLHLPTLAGGFQRRAEPAVDAGRGEEVMNAPGHDEYGAWVRAPLDEIFAYLDDHSRLSAHMGKSSWMTGGARMVIELDECRGRSLGAHIRLSGQVLGVRLYADETVIERDPPRRKVWQTAGEPKLLVIGEYRMGFELVPEGNGVRLCVFIDYALPRSLSGRWLGRLLAPAYARWCTRSMVKDAVGHFAASA